MKTALCRVSDVEPLLSLLPMLEGAGYECVLPNRSVRNLMRDIRCSNVDDFEDMSHRWGCEMPPPRFKEVGLEALNTVDLLVDVAACWNGRQLIERGFKHLEGRCLAYFINGGEPRDVEGKGDCRTPWCPMMVTAQHYRSTLFCDRTHWNKEAFSCDSPPNPRGYWTNDKLSYPQRHRYDDSNPQEALAEVMEEKPLWACPLCGDPLKPAPWLGKVYTFYPWFARASEIKQRAMQFSPPVCLVHNVKSWGGAWWRMAQTCGVALYGGGSSPDGLLRHEEALKLYSHALCTVYAKSGGAVDYSILEPMWAGCPTTFHSSYVHNCRLYDLLEDGETCLMWDDEAGMARCIARLRDPAENWRIGEAGRRRAAEVQWKPDVDQASFNKFLTRNFGD